MSHDASQSEPVEEPVPEEPVADEPFTEAPVQTEEPADDVQETVEPVEEVPEPVTEPAPAEEAAEAAIPEEPAEPPVETAEEPAPAEDAVPGVPEAVVADAAPQAAEPEQAEEELGEDLYTDYSPEAVVRRAAWNKGLRCRRGYGEHNIPVAFVKGKVAVFVDSADADTSIDAKLAEEGWTVLRYDASTITDGKAQGDEIAAAVKANMRASKAATKKKSRK